MTEHCVAVSMLNDATYCHRNAFTINEKTQQWIGMFV